MIVTAISVSALEISEIESNPAGSDSGNEWVELFSDEEVSLEGYYLENKDGTEVQNLSGNFSGYFVVDLDGQWLDNSKEVVFLKKDGEIFDESPEISDGDNNGKTWNKCDEWVFIESSKGEENSCPAEVEVVEEEEIEDESEELEVEEIVIEEPEEKFDELSDSGEDFDEIADLEVEEERDIGKRVRVLEDHEPLVLNSPKVESSESISRRYVLWAFLTFMLLMILLILIRKL